MGGVLSVGMAFCDIPLSPVPENILKLDSSRITPSVPSSGGDALTVANVLGKLGVRTSLVGRVGDDGNGKFLLDDLSANGVDVSRMIVDGNHHTAVSYILIEDSGERHFLIDCSINEVLKSKDVPDEAIKEADLVFFGSALAMPGMPDEEVADLFERAHRYGKTTALDVSVIVEGNIPEKRIDLLRKTLQYTDIFIPSYEEAVFLAQTEDIQEMIRVFSGFPIRILGIKLGGDGCVLTDFKEQVRLSAYPDVKVVDTTGAGDCFMGGFLCAYLHGWDLKKAGCFASAVSAHGISSKGASTGVKDYAAIRDYAEKRGHLIFQ